MAFGSFVCVRLASCALFVIVCLRLASFRFVFLVWRRRWLDEVCLASPVAFVFADCVWLRVASFVFVCFRWLRLSLFGDCGFACLCLVLVALFVFVWLPF